MPEGVVSRNTSFFRVVQSGQNDCLQNHLKHNNMNLLCRRYLSLMFKSCTFSVVVLATIPLNWCRLTGNKETFK